MRIRVRFDLLSEADVAQQSGELLIREDAKGNVVTKGLTHLLVNDEQEALQVTLSHDDGSNFRRGPPTPQARKSSKIYDYFSTPLPLIIQNLQFL